MYIVPAWHQTGSGYCNIFFRSDVIGINNVIPLNNENMYPVSCFKNRNIECHILACIDLGRDRNDRRRQFSIWCGNGELDGFGYNFITKCCLQTIGIFSWRIIAPLIGPVYAADIVFPFPGVFVDLIRIRAGGIELQGDLFIGQDLCFAGTDTYGPVCFPDPEGSGFI